MVERVSEGDRPRVEIGQILFDLLAPIIGKFTARKALEFVAERIGRASTAWGVADVDPVEVALRPMLRTLIGGPTTDRVLQELRNNIEQGAGACTPAR